MSKLPVLEHTFAVPFQPEAGALKRDVPVNLMMVAPEVDIPPSRSDVVAMLGLGNGPNAARHAANHLGALTKQAFAKNPDPDRPDQQNFTAWVTPDVNFRLANPNPTSLRRFAVGVTQGIFDHVRERQGSTRKPIGGIGESKAGLTLALWAEEYAAKSPDVERLAFVRSPGAPLMPQGAFYGGMWNTLRQKEHRTLRLFGVGMRGTGTVVADTIAFEGGRIKFAQGLKFALGVDIVPGVQATVDAKGRENARLLPAEADALVSAVQQQKRLGEAGLADVVQVVNGAHTSPRLELGARQLAAAVQFCRMGQVWPAMLAAA